MQAKREGHRVKRRMTVRGALVLVAAVSTAGCGGGKKQESEGARTACKAPATSQPNGLPAAFPIPGELTLTQVRKDRPTNVVDGYWTAGLDEAYKEYHDQVTEAGYTVLFNEKEEH